MKTNTTITMNDKLKKALKEKSYTTFYYLVDKTESSVIKAHDEIYANGKYEEKDDIKSKVNLIIWSKICGETFDKNDKIVKCNRFYSYENIEGFVKITTLTILKEARDRAFRRKSDGIEKLDNVECLSLDFTSSEKRLSIEVEKEYLEKALKETEGEVNSSKKVLPIRAYDKITYKVIGEYKNASQAARELGLTNSQVSAVLKQTKKSAKGNVFLYVVPSNLQNEFEEKELEYKRNNKKEFKVVIRAFSNKTGKLLKEFNTVSEASTELKCDRYRIAKALKGSIKSTVGFKFEYYSV